MQNQLGKAALSAALLVILTACTQQADAPAAPTAATTPEPAPVQPVAPAPAPKPMSMRVTDVRITTGAQQNKSCNIERANGTLFWPDQPRASRAQTIEIGGWVVDEDTKSVPNGVKLRLQTANGVSAWEQDVTERVERKDVANNLKEEAYLKAGFKVNVDVPDLAPGDYVIYLAFEDAGAEAICGIGRRITLTP